MIIFYKNSKQQKHQRLLDYLYESCPYEKKIFYTEQFSANARLNQKASMLFFAGMIRGEGLIYKWCVSNRKRFFYLDHAYLNRGYNAEDPENEWFRITDSDFLWNKFEHRSPDRWNEFFAKKYKITPWRLGAGETILVLPPSQATQYLFPKSRFWLDQVARQIKEYTNKKIVVREKPTQHIISPNNQIIKPLKFNHKLKIEDELAVASAVVTYSSGVTVDAAMLGIPVICSNNNVAYPISMTLEALRGNYTIKEQEPWFHQLVYHQYRTIEMINGTVWNFLLPNGISK